MQSQNSSDKLQFNQNNKDDQGDIHDDSDDVLQQISVKLNYAVRPRYGNRFYRSSNPSVHISSIYRKIDKPESQPEMLRMLGIEFSSRLTVKVDLEEYPPDFRPQGRSNLVLNESSSSQENSSSGSNQRAVQPIRMQKQFDLENRVSFPLNLHVEYNDDIYFEDDQSFCCLICATSTYGDHYSVPVLGRGSFSLLGDRQQEHCVSGSSASFLQRAAMTMTVLLALCDLSEIDAQSVLDFFLEVNDAYEYGYASYIQFLHRCCSEDLHDRGSYLEYLCLEFNNHMNRSNMPAALKNFLETRKPTVKYEAEVLEQMTEQELVKDQKINQSLGGKSSKAGQLVRFLRLKFATYCTCLPF